MSMSSRLSLLALSLLAAGPAWAQGMNVQIGPNGMAVQVHDPDQPVAATATATATVTTTTTTSSGEAFNLVYEANPERATMMKVLAPEGAGLQVWEGKRLVHEDDVPTSFRAQPDVFYRFVLKFPGGGVWEKKLAARRGQTALLSVAPPVQVVVAPVVVAQPAPVVVVHEQHDHGRRDRHDRHDKHDDRRDHDRRPSGPAAMGVGDFAGLRDAIEAESFENTKLDVLRTAAPNAWFTIDQVGQLVDLFSFSTGKVEVVQVTKPRVLDPQNAFQLYGHFTFESDKAKVRKIYGQR